MSITFRAPCDSSAVEGINVYHNGEKRTFTMRDAQGADFTSVSNLFTTGAYVKVVLDTTRNYAYLQNAATSAHASQHAQDGSDPITPEMIGAPTVAQMEEAIASAIGTAIGGGY